jgi:hypothetical protein
VVSGLRGGVERSSPVAGQVTGNKEDRAHARRNDTRGLPSHLIDLKQEGRALTTELTQGGKTISGFACAATPNL